MFGDPQRAYGILRGILLQARQSSASRMSPDVRLPSDPPASPCIGVCQLLEKICVGCGREIGEIAEWGAASPERKAEIVSVARQRLAIIKFPAIRPVSS